ncbi:MAG: 2-phospho-L-lactate transferase, partial [Actinomycetota bacterium]
GPADRMLRSLGSDSSASGVARLYSDFADLFVVDRADEQEVGKLEALGMRGAALDTVMTDHHAAEKLARLLLDL